MSRLDQSEIFAGIFFCVRSHLFAEAIQFIESDSGAKSDQSCLFWHVYCLCRSGKKTKASSMLGKSGASVLRSVLCDLLQMKINDDRDLADLTRNI